MIVITLPCDIITIIYHLGIVKVLIYILRNIMKTTIEVQYKETKELYADKVFMFDTDTYTHVSYTMSGYLIKFTLSNNMGTSYKVFSRLTYKLLAETDDHCTIRRHHFGITGRIVYIGDVKVALKAEELRHDDIPTEITDDMIMYKYGVATTPYENTVKTHMGSKLDKNIFK